jgi:hypothetical protein
LEYTRCNDGFQLLFALFLIPETKGVSLEKSEKSEKKK